MTAQISACLIVRGDAHIARTLASLRPHVAQICVLFTGYQDEPELAALQDLQAAGKIDRLAHSADCNDAGCRIEDFSLARTQSFALATEPWVTWVDSDDVVRGFEKLPAVLAELDHHETPRALCLYEYATEHATGRLAVRQDRERIVRNDGRFQWIHPVHETLVPKDGKSDTVRVDALVWQHRRSGIYEKGRNLRILRSYVRRFPAWESDAWTRYNLGLECANDGLFAEAIDHLRAYVGLSGWDDERVMALLKLADCHVALNPFGDHAEAIEHARHARSLRPEWFESNYALAKLKLLKGLTGDRAELAEAIATAKAALSTFDTVTPLATRPIDRERHAHDLIFSAHDALGDVDGAISDAQEQLQAKPHHPALLLAQHDYTERKLAKSGQSQHTGKLDIVIACHYTPEAWDPTTPNARGVGGSETAVIEMAKRLVARGARVRVFNLCAHAGLYDGVEYRPLHAIADVKRCDLLIAWRDASLLEHTAATAKWLWVHDVLPQNANAWNIHLADRVLALSEFHAKAIAEKRPDAADKIWVTRNGIDPKRFNPPWGLVHHLHRALYTSSPDRGLSELLDMWPRIRAAVSDAELHIFYADLAHWPKLSERVDAMADLGVIARGRANQADLAREMMSAGAWLYPSWMNDRPFLETSCIGAMEAQAAGLNIVTARCGALPETVFQGHLVAGEATSEKFQDEFVAASIRALTELQPRTGLYRAHAWNGIADEWLEMANNHVAWKTYRSSTHGTIDPDTRPVLHMMLTPNASTATVMDARAPGGEAMGGGSRVGFLGLVEALGKRGFFRVRAFSTFKEPWHVRGGVEYIQADRVATYDAPDVMVAYYDTTPLSRAPEGVLRVASHHTYEPFPADHAHYADIHMAPSREPIAAIRESYAPDGEWYVLPNGVPDCAAPTYSFGYDLRAHPTLLRDGAVEGRVIYHTSWDRGLHLLFRAWPEIRARVPDATLHVVGPIQAMLDGPPLERTDASGVRWNEVREAAPIALAAGGVKLLGRLPRTELDRELAEASCFAFPCDVIGPCETFSLSVAECCKRGIPVVLAPADALKSIWDGAVEMTLAPAADHMPEFVDAVVRVLSDGDHAHTLSRSGRERVADMTFENQAVRLEAIIRRGLMGRKMRDMTFTEGSLVAE